MARGELRSAALVTHHIDRAAHVDVYEVDVHMLFDQLRRLAKVLGARAGELYAEDILVRVRVRVRVRGTVRVGLGLEP